jgi:large subunit ribosomal protein L25
MAALMAGSESTNLEVASRSDRGSRAARRLRRTGRVPGVIYGGDGDAVAFDVDARLLRNTLAHSGAVLELTVDGGGSQPVILKHAQRHPVRGELVHADFLRVDMKVAIQTTVSVEVTGAEEAPGVTEGGVLSQETHQLNIEALPGNIPDSIVIDVSHMQVNETLTLAAVSAPEGVTLLDDPENTVIATITPPTAEPVEAEIETETEVVGEGIAPDADAEASAEAAEAQAEGATGDDAESGSGGDTE